MNNTPEIKPIRLGNWEFRPRGGFALLAAIGIVATFLLGQWQTGRATEKEALQSRLEQLGREPAMRVTEGGRGNADAHDYLLRRVQFRGRFEPRFAVFVDNRIHGGRPGFHVAMPVRISGGDRYVLVNRGWIAAGGDRKAPAVQTPEGEVNIEGVAVPFSERYLELSTKVAEGNIWQNLVQERYRQATGLDIMPFVVQQTGTQDDGLVRDWPRPDLKRNTHLAYAFQWYALSFAIFVYYLFSHVKRIHSPEADAQ